MEFAHHGAYTAQCTCPESVAVPLRFIHYRAALTRGTGRELPAGSLQGPGPRLLESNFKNRDDPRPPARTPAAPDPRPMACFHVSQLKRQWVLCSATLCGAGGLLPGLPQKSEARPFTSQSPKRVGSWPFGPPHSSFSAS